MTSSFVAIGTSDWHYCLLLFLRYGHPVSRLDCAQTANQTHLKPKWALEQIIFRLNVQSFRPETEQLMILVHVHLHLHLGLMAVVVMECKLDRAQGGGADHDIQREIEWKAV